MWMDIIILTCLLYGAVLVSCPRPESYEYQLVNSKKNWTEALKHCRQHYTDLATFKSLEDVNRVKRPEGYGGSAWIGLFDDPASWKGVMGKDSNSWRWSATGTTSPGGYQNWAPGEPDYAAATRQCVGIFQGLWYDFPCILPLRFVCFNGSSESGERSYAFFSIRMTWENARNHCREHYTDLATITNETEDDAVAKFYFSQHVWIGLYREPWRWSDGSPINYTNWHTDEPNNYAGKEHCVIEYPDHTWLDKDCSLKRPFICQAFASKQSLILMKLQAGVDLTQTEVHTQLIQQIGAELARLGITDVTLKWKSPPVLPEKNTEDTN